MVRVTVFTPTYNRAHTLERAYKSLEKQEPGLFEWLVVDDGSRDHTVQLLERLMSSAPFPMRVVQLPHGGKHRAHNAALKHVRGEFVAILDSDDELLPNAIRLLVSEWDAIPDSEKPKFAGVLGHSVLASGQLDGKPYGVSHLDGLYIDLVAGKKMIGDKLPFYKADILKMYPFPEKPGDNGSVAEGAVLGAIGKTYLVRCIEKPVRVYHMDGGNTLSKLHKTPACHAWGKSQCFLVLLNQSHIYLPKFLVYFCRLSVHYVRASLHAGDGLKRQVSRLATLSAKALWVAGLPLGVGLWAWDCLNLRGKSIS